MDSDNKHSLGSNCWCKPIIVEILGKVVIIHREENKSYIGIEKIFKDIIDEAQQVRD